MKSVGVFVVLLAAASLLVGCGPGGPVTHQVTGTVTFDGAPVQDGDIVFRDPAGKEKSYGGRIENGEFSLEVSPGAKRVEITAMREVPGEFDTMNPGEKVPLKEPYIPAEYNTNSTLTAEITGAETLSFDLKRAEDGRSSEAE